MLSIAESISQELRGCVITFSPSGIPYVIGNTKPLVLHYFLGYVNFAEIPSSHAMDEDMTYDLFIERRYNTQLQHNVQPLIRALPCEVAALTKTRTWLQHPPLHHWISKQQQKQGLSKPKIILAPELSSFSVISHCAMTILRYCVAVLRNVQHSFEHYEKLRVLEEKIGYTFKNKLLLRQVCCFDDTYNKLFRQQLIQLMPLKENLGLQVMNESNYLVMLYLRSLSHIIYLKNSKQQQRYPRNIYIFSHIVRI